ASPLGWARFEALAGAAAMPVYALGGLSPEQLAQARTAGAHGVAGIRGFWSAP
ncbi:MAG: thiamine phosphate synthase, partial [Xanthomonadaceae bacterium]|nr:thiamine phosphate synthase [Xanthomonadaceae bacterium]